MSTQSNFRLLVVRLSAMGDVLHALPAVTALRQAHPEWQIDWVVESRWQALLVGSGGNRAGQRTPEKPLVDQVHVAATKAWGKNPLSFATARGILKLRRELRAGEYDAVLDLQGSIRSAVIARLAGCRRVIGASDPRESIARCLYDERVRTHEGTHGVHVIEQAVELANAVAGDALKPALPLLPVDARAEAWAEETLPNTTGQSAILINPGAGWGAKRWPVERYADVASELIARGYRVLVNAGPGEESLASAIPAHTNGAATSVQCSVDQLIALTRRVALVIAGDTGPLHLACALGRPVVAIFGPTDPSRNGPFGVRFKVLCSPQSKRDHRRHTAPEAGLLTISSESVFKAAVELLQSAPRAHVEFSQ